jgi:hypothetical protein
LGTHSKPGITRVITIDNNNNSPIIDLSDHSAAESVPSQHLVYSRRLIRNGLILTLVGFFVFLLGSRPSVFGLDRSPVIGFVQIAALLTGLGIICIGAYIIMVGLRKNMPVSIAAEIGKRLVATGFVISVVAGMADIFGLGSHPLSRPFFGPWQALGVQIGELVIGVGILLMIPFQRIFPPHTKRITKSKVSEIDSEYQ